MSITRITSKSAQETRSAAAALKPRLKPGVVLALHGDLGAGKTCFVQGLADALGCAEPVTSPTFTLLHEYPGDLPLFHADLYRMDSADEVQRAGILEYLDAGGVLAIEWADRAAALLPAATIHVRISTGDEPTTRFIEIEELDPQ
ncbi:MAG: tRNA (adenosine(37)-N6)-threonylcarbamoyltransferase complex ATPase subunit type 1 TsaE [Kiritimatiellae bacterium]|nr:tRNA (adenosine(37)-N6)-threonylcarbamoyltransferase complex ATPase subunit type 1 TsaE [Kiritimatiellia bacterium]MCO5067281.1 tRNA (adenosine(37)-N6)-threonylcarbamoyltransferase complex ATPase subunit type 1 TsaE [Kiritimatiellia bacterium]